MFEVQEKDVLIWVYLLPMSSHPGRNAPINVKPAGGGDRRDIARDFDRSLWPGGRAFEFSCCPGGSDI